jgi:hypothetical protein
LIEVAYEAFRMDLIGPYFKIRDVRNGSWFQDRRSPDMLATRPNRPVRLPNPVEDPYAYQRVMRDHRRALSRWAFETMALVSRRDQAAGNTQYSDEARAWSSVQTLYGGALSQETGAVTAANAHADAIARHELAAQYDRRFTGSEFVGVVPYTSPIRAREREIEYLAHRHFEQTSKALAQQATARLEHRREEVASFAGVPGKEASKVGLLRRWFSKK